MLVFKCSDLSIIMLLMFLLISFCLLLQLVYVMTDFTDENVKFWREHPQLKEYFDDGTMDCAIFDAVSDTKLELVHSKVTLEAGSVKNPICIVANYLFDTLCHDIFQVNQSLMLLHCIVGCDCFCINV